MPRDGAPITTKSRLCATTHNLVWQVRAHDVTSGDGRSRDAADRATGRAHCETGAGHREHDNATAKHLAGWATAREKGSRVSFGQLMAFVRASFPSDVARNGSVVKQLWKKWSPQDVEAMVKGAALLGWRDLRAI